jgi:hypothetical protein
MAPPGDRLQRFSVVDDFGFLIHYSRLGHVNLAGWGAEGSWTKDSTALGFGVVAMAAIRVDQHF